MQVSRLFVILCVGTWAACVSTDPADPADGATGAALAITVGLLDLSGVGKAEYTITVSHPGGLVWTRSLDSVRFGDGVGSLTYVGPCDATNPAHTVTLLLTALYDDDGGLIPATTYRNPTPISVPATCRANSDTAVDINLTILRDARQGFFDIAVDFDDVFCSAKLDCEDSEGNDLHLLHRPGGARDTTVVLGFACTGGPEAGVDTHLYLDDLVVTCTNATYSATVDPSGGRGVVPGPGHPGRGLHGDVWGRPGRHFISGCPGSAGAVTVRAICPTRPDRVVASPSPV